MARVGAVINRLSGTLSPKKNKQRLEEIEEYLRPWVSPEDKAIVAGERVESEIRQMRDRGVEVFVVAGGDGTISTAAGLLSDTDIPILILSLGTRNHFAKDLGMPQDPGEAIQLLESMQVKRVDVGEVNGHKFINNATIGLYPRLVEERDEKMKKRGWKKWRAQMAAVLIVLRRLPQMRITVIVKEDNFKVNRFTPFLFVGNNEYREETNTDFARSSLAEGRLWLCMAQLARFRSLLQMAWQIAVKGIRNTEQLEIHRVTSATVHPRRKRVTVAVDGETIKMSSPLRFNIRKKSLQVVVP